MTSPKRIFSTQITDKGVGKSNEDIGTVQGDTAWVLDGATGLSPKQYFSGSESTDARWLVERLDLALRECVFAAPSLLNALRSAVRRVREEALKTVPSLEGLYEYAYEQPSCSVCMVRVKRETIEYLVLGDCSIVYKVKDRVSVITDRRNALFEQRAIDSIKRYQREQGVSFNEAMKWGISNILRRQREKINTIEGYWAATVDGQGVERALSMEIPLFGPCSILLCTDGFVRLVDLFDACTWEDIFDYRIDLPQALKMLRRAEENDSECLKFPRLKIFDDATAILLER